jgi:hypothetical protein
MTDANRCALLAGDAPAMRRRCAGLRRIAPDCAGLRRIAPDA